MSTSPETSSNDSNSCPICQKVFKTSSGLKYHIAKQVCVKSQKKEQAKDLPQVPEQAQAQANVEAPEASASSDSGRPVTKVPVLITPIKPPTPTQASPQQTSVEQAPAKNTPLPTGVESDYKQKRQTSIEEMVANQLDPTKKKLLYVEKGYKHKTDLDPKRFDCLRFLKVASEENPDIPFEEIMSKTEYLLNDSFFWIRWRDISTH